jgi:hypothetical protein
MKKYFEHYDTKWKNEAISRMSAAVITADDIYTS